MSGITPSRMIRQAENIGERRAKVGGLVQAKLVATNRNNPDQNTNALAKVRQTLSGKFTPPVANEALAEALDLTDTPGTVNTHVRDHGITGEDIEYSFHRANLIRSAKLFDANTPPAEKGRLHVQIESETFQWPKGVTGKQKTLVMQQAAHVMGELARSNDDLANEAVTLVFHNLAEVAASFPSKDNLGLSMELGRIGGQIIAAIDNGQANAVLGKNKTLSNIKEVLRPPLKFGRTDLAQPERTERFRMVETTVNRMQNTQVNVTLDDNPTQLSLQDVFDGNNNHWGRLSPADRQTVIKSFMDLHAQTHGYDNVQVHLKTDGTTNAAYPLNADGDDVSQTFPKESHGFQLELTPMMFESDSPTHVLKTLAHEMTHIYQFTLMDGSNANTGATDDRFIERLNFDYQFRSTQDVDTNMQRFGDNAKRYTRDAMERGAVESEWAFGQFQAAQPPGVAQLVTQTDDIHLNFAATIRVQGWSDAQTSYEQLAANAPTAQERTKHLTSAVSLALELGEHDGNLVHAGHLLGQLDYTGMSNEDIVKFTSVTIRDLQNLDGRARATAGEKALAQAHLATFQGIKANAERALAN